MSEIRGRSRLGYLLAASHSGSTLTAMLLNSHPRICTVGELKITRLGGIDSYRCSCQRFILDCPFWQAVGHGMARRGIDFSIADAGTDVRTGATPYIHRLLAPLHRGPVLEALRDVALNLSPVWRRQLPYVQSINAALVSSVLECSGKDVIVDSSKIGIRLKYLLRNPDLDVKVVRLIRDGRAVTLTYMDPEGFADAKDPKLRGGGSGTSRADERLSVEAAAREWRRSNEEAEAILATLDKSRWLAIRYEDLCASPDETLNRVFEFLGVGAIERWVQFRDVEHHVIGNGMRLDSSSEIRLDERWKSALTSHDLRVFDVVAGDLNRRLGYA